MAIKGGDIVWEVRARVKQFVSDLKNADSKAGQFSRKLIGQSRRVGIAMTAMGAGIVGALGVALKGSVDFRNEMAKVATLGIDDLGKLSDEVRKVTREFGLELKDSVEATYQAISAGANELTAPKILEDAAIAATAGMTDLTTAIQLGAGISNAFGIEMKDMTQVFDQAFAAVKTGITDFDQLANSVGRAAPIFKGTGSSTADLFAALAGTTKAGIQTSEVISGLKAIMQAILQPTSKATAAAKDLEIQFDITAFKTMGLVGFFANK